ncbi:ATPases involved in biogenesis of archaeal flagella [Legionella moravica]|uniref:ATPases involved in biogenesis of archaeal flagella n=1 Tax=Legionella moravica TaxID=39962 RepID=A0A378JSQ8_9GAMM|nr:alpha/beta hydrolase [Legionella moravica]KTD39226.1 ATPases involved in biogenesis of archaeal flagella [Legionella moravica]STX61765.1 ATPases involved in biogenesis of archaeal flagella [Legionella moravica]
MTRMILLFFFITTSVWADQFEIKIDQQSLELPYWPAQANQYGAVLIVRGGDQPQWSDLLAQCAKQLSAIGWSVVLLNCSPSNTVPWIKQLPEVISSLRQDKNKRIIMIHYGEQLNLSLDYFSKPQAKMINGLVLISAYGDDSIKEKAPSLRFPIFDVAGQFDYDFVLTQMNDRKKEYRERSYFAVEMPGADHDYDFSRRLLVSFVHGWMTKLPETQALPRSMLESYIEPVYSSQSQVVSIEQSDWTGFIDNPVEP